MKRLVLILSFIVFATGCATVKELAPNTPNKQLAGMEILYAETVARAINLRQQGALTQDQRDTISDVFKKIDIAMLAARSYANINDKASFDGKVQSIRILINSVKSIIKGVSSDVDEDSTTKWFGIAESWAKLHGLGEKRLATRAGTLRKRNWILWQRKLRHCVTSGMLAKRGNSGLVPLAKIYVFRAFNFILPMNNSPFW
jgi:hypothetical protein